MIYGRRRAYLRANPHNDARAPRNAKADASSPQEYMCQKGLHSQTGAHPAEHAYKAGGGVVSAHLQVHEMELLAPYSQAAELWTMKVNYAIPPTFCRSRRSWSRTIRTLKCCPNRFRELTGLLSQNQHDKNN